MTTFIFFFVLTFSTAFAQKKVAIVSMLRGDAVVIEAGREKALAKEMWVTSGSTVKTKEKSVVKLTFVDKSTMNIGPNSQMKIEQFGGADSGVIDLVKGKIRSQVSKDYLQQDKSKSKVFVKTQNAVMGIRGTDFMISTNGVNTSAVLFEGNVVFSNFDGGKNYDTNKLEQIVDSGERIMPGQFSVVSENQPPTIPSSLNVQQLENLERNQTFEDKSGSAEDKSAKSIVPPGLTGEQVGNNSEALKSEVKQVGADSAALNKPLSTEDARGFEQDGKIKPASGSFVHIDSGVVIPPPADAVFDQTTGTFIAGSNGGAVDDSGNYVPPKGVEISPEGKVEVVTTNAQGSVVRKEIEIKPIVVPTAQASSPVANNSSAQNQPGAPKTNAPMAGPNPTVANLQAPPPPTNDILNAAFTPNLLQDVSNFQQNTSGSPQNVNQAVQNNPTTPVNFNIGVGN
jgi:hypothetical protein